MAVIGVLTLEMRFEESHSLKEKRHWVKGLKDRLRSRLNVAVAETEDHDRWQTSTITAVTVSPSREHAAHTLQSAEAAASDFLGRQLISATVDWID